jgi:hypothetical protein
MDQGDRDVFMAIIGGCVGAVEQLSHAPRLVRLPVQAVLDRKSSKETGPSDPDMVKEWKNYVKPLTHA